MAEPVTLRGEQVDKIVATVDGDPITLQDVRSFVAQTNAPPLPPGNLSENETFKAALKALIAEKLLEREVKKYDDKIEDSQIDHYIADLEHDKGVTDQQLRESMMQNGVSYDDFRKQAKVELEKGMMINEQLRNKVSIPESDIRSYYDSHKDEFTVKEERFQLAQVLIAVPDKGTPEQVAAARARAEEVRRRAVAGQDFGSLARQFSDDESKEQGGELGVFGSNEIMDEILAAVKNLKTGDISPVVHSKNGFHVLKVEQHEQPGVKPYAAVRDEIRNNLIDVKAKARMKDWVETDLVKQHYVQTLY